MHTYGPDSFGVYFGYAREFGTVDLSSFWQQMEYHDLISIRRKTYYDILIEMTHYASTLRCGRKSSSRERDEHWMVLPH